ncbi:MAG: ATP-dependent DNA helicase RecG, partial [Longimicrobiales bacterium]|nr:ATP-dependent DNA helicase RecG [Longimicrobiales bacterium]
FSQLDKPIQFLKGVGPRRAENFGRMGIVTARDLLYHVPRRYDDASTIQAVAGLEVGMDATAVGRVRSMGIVPTRSGLRIFQAVLQDESGMITCAWPGQPWLDRKIRKGDLLLVTGPVKFFHGRQLQPREFTLLGREGEEGENEAPGTIFVSYPASEEVPQWILRRVFDLNLEWLLIQVEVEEYLDAGERGEAGLISLAEALNALHRPSTLAQVEGGRRRLAFDELFFLQLVQAQVRFQQTEAQPGIAFRRTNELIRPLHESLPFDLTDAQARVLREILSDMSSPRRMSRLLQGDVGSGKTVVALFAMAMAVEGGYQAVLMAPTEILAEQHARKLGEMLEPLGVDVVLLTGSLSAGERRVALEKISKGSGKITVGTHALIQEGVEFNRLGMVVVDEQHRFGVRQRMVLGEKDSRPDVLVMSATPIPRSFAMALYGDLDLSVIDGLPPGRKPVETQLRSPRQRASVYRFLDRELNAGRQGYLVYPLVDESDKVDLRSATEDHRRLSEEVFPHREVGLLHGQLSGKEKDAVMRAVLAGGIDLLVATTVIEVGIDVPNATVMVIEHAERFGLSQLHQLRGRVGRGGEQSYCILVSQPGELAQERLRIFQDTTDGFEIARADLQIRGQGDLFGAQQHGRDPILSFADLSRDGELLRRAQARARTLVAQDPELAAPANGKVLALLRARHQEKLRMFGVG